MQMIDRFKVVIAAFLIAQGAHSVVFAQRHTARRRAQRAADTFDPSSEQFLKGLFGVTTVEEQKSLAAIEISIADERRLGENIVQAYLKELESQNLKVIERGRDVDYLRDLVNTIRPFMTNKNRYRTIKIYVVDSPQTDARSIPGGTLFFFRGLLDFSGSEAALVGVVGHELSHLDRGHQLGPLRRMKLFEQTIQFDPREMSPARMFAAVGPLVEGYARPFRPEDEAEADRDGAHWAFQAGYDPRELANMFVKLHRRDGDEVPMLSFLKTHPYRLDRSRAVREQYAIEQEESPNDDLYVGRKNLSQRVSRAKRVFAEK